ncbi:hypothetical protein M0R04_12730 [Candidatus Dojkabacteria bacterium]|jgi:hypothetical protein|nr:hypothetical protein [Candidatus Dojkabacteria bacterium]
MIKGIKKTSKKELLELRDMTLLEVKEWCDFLNEIDTELHRRIDKKK